MVAVLRLLATMRLSRFGARNERLSRGIYSYTPCLMACQDLQVVVQERSTEPPT